MVLIGVLDIPRRQSPGGVVEQQLEMKDVVPWCVGHHWAGAQCVFDPDWTGLLMPAVFSPLIGPTVLTYDFWTAWTTEHHPSRGPLECLSRNVQMSANLGI